MQTRNVEYGDIKLKTVTRKQTAMERYDPHYTRPVANLDFEAFDDSQLDDLKIYFIFFFKSSMLLSHCDQCTLNSLVSCFLYVD